MNKKITRYECIEEALEYCIICSELERKQIAAMLWPSLKIETSYPKFNECLNRHKSAKFSMDEIIFIMNLCGRYDPLYYMADGAGHKRPELILVEEEEQTLANSLQNSIDEALRVHKELIQLTKERDELKKRNASVNLKLCEEKFG